MNSRQDNIPLVSIVIALCFVLVGCGPEDEPARVELPPATIRWITWDTNSQAEKLLIQQFQEQYPQQDFERTSQNMGITQYLDDTPPPDLVNVDAGTALAELASAAQIADLTELWMESGLLDHVPASVQQLSTYQDRQFYVPVAVGWKAIYYNKQIFADYDLTPPETWDDFLAICETLLANGETPLAISGNDAWPIQGWFEYLNLRINGPQFYRDLMAGKERFDDPRVLRVMETWQNLFINGYFVERPSSLGDLASMTALIRGDNGMLGGQKAVMVLGTTYLYGSLPTPFQAELDFFRFPVMDPSLPLAEVVEPFGYAVPVGADHLPSTMAFLKFVSSREGQLLASQAPIYQTIHYAPARSDVEVEQLSDGVRKGLSLINSADETAPAYFYAVPRQMFGLTYNRFISFVNKPEDIETFITKFEETRQQMVDKGLLLNE
jgi:ABC-type glycerol-3-phosphate transport system substrate-binding protein